MHYYYSYLLNNALKITEIEQLLNNFDHLKLISNMDSKDFHFVERVLNIKGSIFFHKGDIEKSLYCLKESEKIGVKTNSTVLSETYYNFSILSIYTINLDDALDYISKSFKYCDAECAPFDVISGMYVKADILARLGRLKEAEVLLLDALDLTKKYKISKHQIYIEIISELAIIKNHQNDNVSFYSYFSEFSELIEILNKPYLKANYTLNFLQTLIYLRDFENAQKVINKLDKWILIYQLPIRFILYLNYLKATNYIFQNKLEQAEFFLSQINKNEKNEEISFKNHPTLRDIKYVSLANFYRKTNNLDQALAIVNSLLDDKRLIISKIRLLVLKSIILFELKRQPESLKELEVALLLAEDSEVISPFIYFREEVALLINIILQGQKNRKIMLSKSYIQKLIISFNMPELTSNIVANEVFSENEIQVLKLMEKGLSRIEISNTLYLSINTIKTRLKIIYSKLDAKNNTEAVFKAKKLNII